MAIYGDGKHNENMEHIPKKEFKFYVDKKVSMWIRDYHVINADNQDEANRIMIDTFKNNSYDNSFDYREFLYGSEIFLEPGDNNGEATQELFTDNIELLTTNLY